MVWSVGGLVKIGLALEIGIGWEGRMHRDAPRVGFVSFGQILFTLV